jgi:hypothetical protein
MQSTTKKTPNKLKTQSALQRMCLVFAKFTTKWSIGTQNETFSSCKVHNRMKHWNNNDTFNSCEVHNKMKH